MVERILDKPSHSEQTQVKLEVPILGQLYRNWCGYTSLSMVFQYWGYKDLTPEKLFSHINPEFTEDIKKPETLSDFFDLSENPIRHLPGPSIDTLALIAQELTPLKVDLFTEKHFEKLKQKNISPYDVLNAYLVKRQTPCILRGPQHFVVAVGTEIWRGERLYIINNPSLGGWKEIFTKKQLEERWRHREEDYPRDTRHLMLAIHP